MTLLIVLLLVHIPDNHKKQATNIRQFLEKLDIPGTILLLPSTVCLLLALQWGGTKYSWDNWRCVLLFCIFGVFGIAWCVVQVWEGDNATIPLRLLKMRSIITAMWFAFCLFGMMFVQSYYVPIWFQALQDKSAYQAGIDMLSMSVAMTLAFVLTGALVRLTILPAYYDMS